jgi:DNA-directed RNA polymerase subunit RPC12/RpoP
MARLALLVRCRACGREFDTGIRMATRNFAKATLAANYHRCPHCGQRGTYRKADYATRSGGAGDDAAPPSDG